MWIFTLGQEYLICHLLALLFGFGVCIKTKKVPPSY